VTSGPVHALLAAASETANRRDVRVAWVHATTAAWREAQREMDERCCEAVDRLSEQAFHALFQEEQAKVDAIRAPLIAVAERDVWPRHLYFGCV